MEDNSVKDIEDMGDDDSSGEEKRLKISHIKKNFKKREKHNKLFDKEQCTIC